MQIGVTEIEVYFSLTQKQPDIGQSWYVTFPALRGPRHLSFLPGTLVQSLCPHRLRWLLGCRTSHLPCRKSSSQLGQLPSSNFPGNHASNPQFPLASHRPGLSSVAAPDIKGKWETSLMTNTGVSSSRPFSAPKTKEQTKWIWHPKSSFSAVFKGQMLWDFQ